MVYNGILRGWVKKPAVATAVASPKARHADQPLDLSLLHCGNEHSRCCGEETRRLEWPYKDESWTQWLADRNAGKNPKMPAVKTTD
jgi:hypothetical protein